MNFEKALEALREGKMVSRAGSHVFIFMQVPSVISKEIVPKMTSLPQSVKDEFCKRFNNPDLQMSEIYYSDQFASCNQSNLIVGWSPTASDVLAEDWGILE